MEFNETAQNNVRRYNEQFRAVKMVLYAELRSYYKESHGLEMAKVMAAQVVNYLAGEDIDAVYEKAAEPLKSKIGRIKDQIPKLAEEKMERDSGAREIIIYSLKMEEIYKLAQLGEAYYKSADKGRIERIMAKYGTEFPIEVSPSIYSLLVTKFLQERQHLLQN